MTVFESELDGFSVSTNLILSLDNSLSVSEYRCPEVDESDPIRMVDFNRCSPAVRDGGVRPGPFHGQETRRRIRRDPGDTTVGSRDTRLGLVQVGEEVREPFLAFCVLEDFKTRLEEARIRHPDAVKESPVGERRVV